MSRSDLELVELVGSSRYDIFGSAIRHATLSRAPEATEIPTIEVDVKHTLLAQLWVSGDVTGKVSVHDCQLAQVWNGARRAGASVDFTVAKSLLHRNAAVDESDWMVVTDPPDVPIEKATVDLADLPYEVRHELLTKFGAQAMRADYRQNPARSRDVVQARDAGESALSPTGESNS